MEHPARRGHPLRRQQKGIGRARLASSVVGMALVAALLTGCRSHPAGTRTTHAPEHPGNPPEASAAARSSAQPGPTVAANQPGTSTAEPAAAKPVAWPPALQTFEEMGVIIRCRVAPAHSDAGDRITAGDDVVVRFEINDATTGAPLTGLNPGAWIDGRNPADHESCHDKMESFLTGSLSARAEFDLNAFYVLAMNEEASITVVDPLFGYGGTKLLAMIQLAGPGEDWVLGGNGNRLYVTMPLVNQVAVIDTATWKVLQNVDVGVQPTRIALQPDGQYLWVSCLSPAEEETPGTVVVIDTDTLKPTARLPIGRGHHRFAFSTNSLFAYVTNDKTTSLSVIDVQTRSTIANIDVGESAGGVVYSATSRSAYAVDTRGGGIVVVDGRTHEVTTRIVAQPGLGTIKAVPGDRYLFVANEKEDTVEVIDVASNTIIQTADVGSEPEQIIFSLNLAYVRSRGSELVLMIPLDQVGKGGPLSIVDFTGGHAPFGLAAHPSSADGMALAPSGLAVVVANPVDKSIYYYREGMAAPMGEFTNYGREPRAVLIVDRSLHEVSPGVYTTKVNLDRAGDFDVAVLLDAPRVIHCFDLRVGAKPTGGDRTGDRQVQLRLLTPQRIVASGERVILRYEVTETGSGKRVPGIEDFGVLMTTPDNWQERLWAEPLEDGLYEVTFVPPRPGIYYVYCRVLSMGLRYRDVPFFVMRAEANTTPTKP